MKKINKTVKIAAVLLALICFAAPGAPALTKQAFLAALYDARVPMGTENTEAGKAAFMAKHGVITDNPGKLSAHVTRREALRWCVEALGLSYEAEILSGVGHNFGFKDIGKLSDFERGCLAAAVTMSPQLFRESQNFNGAQRISDKDGSELLRKFAKACRDGLTLDAESEPLDGLVIKMHRDGVPTETPRWRVYAYGFKDRDAAVSAQKYFKANGFDMEAIHPLYEWYLRTKAIDDYTQVKRLSSAIKKRGLRPGVLPSLSNPVTELIPRYWAMLTINPDYWRMVPLIPRNGPRALAPLSRITKENGAAAAINAGFFAVTAQDTGYPIGALKSNGELLNKPYAGRSCLGWNENDEFLIGLLDDGALSGATGTGSFGSFNNYNLSDLVAPQDWTLDSANNANNTSNSDSGGGWDSMPHVIQAGPLLLDDGEARRGDEGFGNSIITARHPRSVVGLTNDGQWFFFVMDGRNGLHSSGATLSELTDILRQCGASCALNLDGGGSTALIVNGRLYNFPSEGKERSVSYGLGVLGRE